VGDATLLSTRREGACECFQYAALVPWCPGALVPWCPGALVPWCPGALVPWCPGALVGGHVSRALADRYAQRASHHIRRDGAAALTDGGYLSG
jgi:hypothetical protein